MPRYWLSIFLLCGSILVGIATSVKSYLGYKLLRVYTNSAENTKLVLDLESLYGDVEFLSRQISAQNASIDMLLSRAKSKDVLQLFKQHHIEFQMINDNLESIISRDMSRMFRSQQKSRIYQGQTLQTNDFNTLENIQNWLAHISSEYPHVVHTTVIGRTSENRPLTVVRIGTNSLNPGIWIDSGIHAREWLTIATNIYFIHNLVTKYGKDKEITQLVQEVNWHILPVHNPDGYEYTTFNERLWRKNRNPHNMNITNGNCTHGVDLNRNWDEHYGHSYHSYDEHPCKSTYRGIGPESEPCVRYVADYLRKNADNIRIFVTMHTFGQLWLIPWSWTYTKAEDYDDLYIVSREAADALQKVHGRFYTVGSGPMVLYACAGTSSDWAKAVAKIKYSFTLELRPATATRNEMFVISKEQIIPSGEETWEGVSKLVKRIFNIRL